MNIVHIGDTSWQEVTIGNLVVKLGKFVARSENLHFHLSSTRELMTIWKRLLPAKMKEGKRQEKEQKSELDYYLALSGFPSFAIPMINRFNNLFSDFRGCHSSFMSHFSIDGISMIRQLFRVLLSNVNDKFFLLFGQCGYRYAQNLFQGVQSSTQIVCLDLNIINNFRHFDSPVWLYIQEAMGDGGWQAQRLLCCQSARSVSLLSASDPP